MSPSKSSKQRRAAQNRAQRSALAARREAASATRTSGSPSSGASGGRRSLLGRWRGGAGGAVGAGGIRATAAASRRAQPVGYRAGLSALLMALAGLVFCFTFQVPVDADGETYTRERLVADWAGTAARAAADAPDSSPAELVDAIGDEWTPGRGSEPIAVALWPFSLALALPVIAAGFGFRAIHRRATSRIVSRAMFALLFASLLSQIPFFFLPSVVALGVAVFQIRKSESAAAAAALAAEDDDGRVDDDVIDADVVDDEGIDDVIDDGGIDDDVSDVDDDVDTESRR